MLSNRSLRKEKKTPLDFILNAGVYAVSFFIFNGFYASLAFGISIFGSAASRFVSIPLRLMTTVIMIFVIIMTVNRNKRDKSKQVIVNFVFFLFWALYFLKVFWQENSDFALRLSWPEYVFYAFNFVILPFFMFGQISFIKYKKIIINALISSGFAMGLASVFLYREVLLAGVARIELYVYQNPDLETLNPLALSYASVLTIMLCVYQLLFLKEKSKLYTIYLSTTIGLALVMFLLGASRGSVLAIVVSIAYLVLQSNYKIKLKVGLLIAAMTPIFIWSVAVSGSGVISRTTQSLGSGSTGREKLWMDAWNEFIKYPILGGRVEIGYYPHNIVLEVLMATGILGMLLISILWVKGLFKITYLPKVNTDYIWVGIILLQGFCQYFFSAALYQSTLIFFPLGIILSKYVDKNQYSDKF